MTVHLNNSPSIQISQETSRVKMLLLSAEELESRLSSSSKKASDRELKKVLKDENTLFLNDTLKLFEMAANKLAKEGSEAWEVMLPAVGLKKKVLKNQLSLFLKTISLFASACSLYHIEPQAYRETELFQQKAAPPYCRLQALENSQRAHNKLSLEIAKEIAAACSASNIAKIHYLCSWMPQIIHHYSENFHALHKPFLIDLIGQDHIDESFFLKLFQELFFSQNPSFEPIEYAYRRAVSLMEISDLQVAMSSLEAYVHDPLYESYVGRLQSSTTLIASKKKRPSKTKKKAKKGPSQISEIEEKSSQNPVHLTKETERVSRVALQQLDFSQEFLQEDRQDLDKLLSEIEKERLDFQKSLPMEERKGIEN